ncbi:hypothetical protein MEX01_16060 [Methylorubrum extorquens]|nr:hypothetical protein MEX01_16060 [Methylorubrum extorquens]
MAAVARRAIAGVTIGRISLSTPTTSRQSKKMSEPASASRRSPDIMGRADASSMPGNHGEVVDGPETPPRPLRPSRRNRVDTGDGRLVFAQTLP